MGHGVGKKTVYENISAVLLEYTTQQINSSLNTKGGRMKGGQGTNKTGKHLFQDNASPTVPRFSNPKIENKHNCCARVLGFYRKKWAGNR